MRFVNNPVLSLGDSKMDISTQNRFVTITTFTIP